MTDQVTATDGLTGDSALVDRFRAGDSDAATALYERHFPMAVRLARRTGPHPAEAEEIASESFARVLEAIRRGGGPKDSFSLYLRTTVRNASFGALRHRARMHTIDDIERVVVDHVPDHAEFGRDIDSDLSDAFNGLSERHRKVLHARVLEGRSNRESAALLGIAPTAEAMLYSRARRALRASYEDTESGRLRAGVSAALEHRRGRHAMA